MSHAFTLPERIVDAAKSGFRDAVDELDLLSGIYNGTLTEEQKTSIRGAITASGYVANRTDLKALNINDNTVAVLQEDGRQGIFIWRDGDYSAEILADTAEGVFIQADNVSPSIGAWIRSYDDYVNVRWFGAQEGTSGDRVVNSTAFLRAKTVADLVCGGRVHVPAGRWRVNSLSDMLSGTCTLSGAGRNITIIDWHDGTPAGQQNATTKIHLFYHLPSDDAISYFCVRDLTISGNLEESHSITTNGQERIFCFLLYTIDKLIFYNVGWENIRDSALEARRCDEVIIVNCYAEKIARAGFNVSDCDNFLCENNVIKYTDDDAIALHTVPSGRVPHNVVVVGNKMEDTLTGLNMLGIKNALIADNQIDRPRFRGLTIGFEWSYDDPASPTVDESTINEGATTNLGISIHDNVISDLINRTTIDSYHDTPIGIHVRNISRMAAALNAPPGRNDTTTSTVIPLAPYVWVNGSSASGTDPLAAQGGSIGVSIKNNKVISSRDPTGTYSEMFGVEMFTKAGWLDPTMTEAILRTGWGICVRGPHRGMDISGNMIFGQLQGITTEAPSSSLGTSDGATLINCRISGNILSHIYSTSAATYGMQLLPETDEEDWLGTVISENIFDLDPEGRCYARNRPGSGSTYRFDGTWSAAGALPGIYAPNIKGVSYRHNTFRNVSRPFNKHADTLSSDNILYCYPAVVGTFDVTNKGIGFVPSPGEGFKYVVVGCDPSSADFNKVLNVMAEFASAEPISGLYVDGWMVNDSLRPVSGGKMRIGWRRVGTGSTHAAASWLELKVDAA